MVSDVVKTPSRRAFRVLILLAGLLLTCLLSPLAAASPGRALLFGLLVVVAAFTAAASPLFAILSVPGSWGADRLPGTGELLSISDGLLLVGLLVPLLLVDFRRTLLRWALVTIAAFQSVLFISLVHAPTIVGLGEWLHRLALVGGSVLIGAYLMQCRQFKTAFQILVLLSVIMAVASVIYTVTSGFQPSYALGFQKNVIGDMLAATALISYGLPRDLLGFDRLRGPIIALLIAGLASSQSRGAAIALGFGTIVMLIARRSFGIRTAMVLLGALGLITFTAIQVQQDATAAAISGNPFGSVASRLTFQRQALEVWQASPIVGGGLRVFASQGSPLQSDPHNVIILTLAEGGLVGLAAFGLLLVGVAVAVWRSGSSLAPLALGLLAFRFAHGLFDVYWVHGTQVLPWMVAGAALTMDRERARVTMGGRVPTSSVLPLGNAVRRPLIPSGSWILPIDRAVARISVAALLAMIVAGGTAVVFGSQLQRTLGLPFQSPASSPPSGSSSAGQGAREAQPSPTPPEMDLKKATLQSADLGPAYRLIQEKTAAFKEGTLVAPASWDVVYRRDSSDGSSYRLCESIVVAYPSSQDASSELVAEASVEVTSSAERQYGILGLPGGQVWLEPVADQPHLHLVRVIWQSKNLVGQVALVGPQSSTTVAEAVGLANMQQRRMTEVLTSRP